MKKQKTTKRAFISSLISLALCVTMLVGTTFAWYTDSVTSGRNTIVAGSLDMVLEKYIGTDDDFSAAANWETVTDQTKIFNETAGALTFEPGAVQVAYVRVKNEGDLAFKYSLAAKVYGEETKGTNQAGVKYKLSDYLKFGTATVTAPFATREAAIAAVPNAAKLQDATLSADGAKLEKGADPVIVALVIYMPSDVGNDANPQPDKKPSITFGLNALATQATIENDSFSNTYDDAATLNFAPVANATAFTDALSAGLPASLESDVALGEVYQVQPGQDAVINGNGNTLSSTTGNRVINIDTADNSSITLNGVDVSAPDKERGISIYGSDDVEVNLNHSKVEAKNYAINVASANTDTKIDINNSTVTAWSGINVWSPSTIINLNSSDVIGINDKSVANSNNFATIVVNQGAAGTSIAMKNGKVVATATNANMQWCIINKDTSTYNFENVTFELNTNADNTYKWFIYLNAAANITLTNCTFIVDGVEITDLNTILNDYCGFGTQEAIENTVLIVDGNVISLA